MPILNIIIVGGSGLYLKSSLYDFTLNEQVTSIDMSKYDSYSNEELYEELKSIDEIASKNIHPNNRKRVLRAIQIYLESGKKKSDIIAAQEHKLLYDVTFVGLSKEPRNELYKMIDDRVIKMFEEGLLEEVGFTETARIMCDDYDNYWFVYQKNFKQMNPSLMLKKYVMEEKLKSLQGDF